MASVVQIVELARGKLRINADEEPLTASEAEKGRVALNNMLSGWKLEGVILSAPTFALNTDLVSIDTPGLSTLTDEANEALSCCLAIRLADNYGVAPSALTIAMCTQGKANITNQMFAPENVHGDMDPGLLNMPSQRLGWRR